MAAVSSSWRLFPVSPRAVNDTVPQTLLAFPIPPEGAPMAILLAWNQARVRVASSGVPGPSARRPAAPPAPPRPPQPLQKGKDPLVGSP